MFFGYALFYMKRFLAGLFALIVLAGAGCSVGNIPLLSGNVKGDWRLTFDLPEGWAIVRPYSEPGDTSRNIVTELNRNLSEVYVQSTDKAVIVDGTAPGDAVPADSYVMTDYTVISVTRLDERRVVPSEAEDFGNGFFHVGDDYYLETETGKYKFTFKQNGQDPQAAIDVILSAQEVTEFTDEPEASDIQVETK